MTEDEILREFFEREGDYAPTPHEGFELFVDGDGDIVYGENYTSDYYSPDPAALAQFLIRKLVA